MSKKKNEEDVKLTIETTVEEPVVQGTEESSGDTKEESLSEEQTLPEEKTDGPQSLKEMIEEHGQEESEPVAGKMTLAKVLGGEMLTSVVVKRQIGVLILITGFIIIYIANGYQYRRTLLEIDVLKDSLKKAKIESMTSTSNLTKYTRKTKVIQMLRENGDTLLKVTNVPPTIIYDDIEE